ncbi:MAG: hypothetical protein H6767_06345 [Candidatus Peribacteria bacterium]|nr:MAG: hypothetical protein H6767_06345 [Candidatus Peribacteria bacterium]
MLKFKQQSTVASARRSVTKPPYMKGKALQFHPRVAEDLGSLGGLSTTAATGSGDAGSGTIL